MNISRLRPDDRENIWFGDFDGVHRYDGKTITDFKNAAGKQKVSCQFSTISINKVASINGNTHSVTFPAHIEDILKSNGSTLIRLDPPPEMKPKSSFPSNNGTL